ncbi:hypothetical protein [Thermococcus sp.]
MEHRYWALVFILYFILIIPLGPNENIGLTEMLGLLILLTAWHIDTKIRKKKKSPYIIGNSNKIEYLTQEELKERLKNR